MSQLKTKTITHKLQKSFQPKTSTKTTIEGKLFLKFELKLSVLFNEFKSFVEA